MRRARRRAKLTLRDVQEIVGVSVSYISDVERGAKPLAAKRIPQFSAALALSDHEQQVLYLSVGCLPEGPMGRLLGAPELWNADFQRLHQAVEAAITILISVKKPGAARALRRAQRGL